MTKGETIAMWIGRVLTALIGLLLVASGISKFVMDAPSDLPEELLPVIGTIEIVVALIYLFPPTSLLGAILVVGYMGGAIFAHMRLGELWIVQAIIPLLAGVGIYLREPRLWSLLPVRRFPKADAELDAKK